MAEQPKGQQCGNCRYFIEETEENYSGCRRYPPSHESGDEDEPYHWYDTTHAESWCGEWTPANPETVDEGAMTLARMVLLGDLTAARALADKLRE